MTTLLNIDSGFGQSLVDGLLERYVSWREECLTVHLALNSGLTPIATGASLHTPGTWLRWTEKSRRLASTPARSNGFGG